ncbi:SET domain-containing protein 5 [Apiospora marii]|uniref:SET domain-containing protein 5 n=1 Tax=Apiospora marii TaxID=335849 RepID=UPI00312FF7E4
MSQHHHVLSALCQSPRATQQQFLSLRNDAGAPFTNIAKAFAENSFAIGDPEAGAPRHGFFPLMSRFNHSCLPNAAVGAHRPGRGPSGHARHPRDAGRRRGRGDYVFLRPALCVADGARAPRGPGLRFMLPGGDDPTVAVAGSEPFHIIADPAVRKQVAEFRTPLSSQLVYNLLTVCLMEAEGILDDFEFGRLHPSCTAMAKMFRRPKNASIARRAMAQSTPSERLRVSFELYGCSDAADEQMANTLRAMQAASLSR